MFKRIYNNYYDCSKNEVISTEISRPINFKRLEEFLNNVENNQPDAIRTIIIGIEGDPYIYHMFYDTEKIIVVFDTTNEISSYTKKLVTLYKGDSIQISEKDNKYIEYTLMNDGIEQTRVFIYNKNFQNKRGGIY